MREERLKHVADIRVSNVDKKSAHGDPQVRLCNYTDVYYNERITGSLDFMAATATREQRAVFGLRSGDVVLTKDSETADDIGVSAFVADDVPDLVCGYHLAIVRARSRRAVGEYLRWVLASTLARQRMSASATGVTRFGLRTEAIADLPVPIPPLATQRAIADYLDRETARTDALIAAKRRMAKLLEERRKALRDHVFESQPGWRLKRLLAASMAYGVLVPEFVAPGTGVPMIRTYNLSAKGRVSHEDIAEIPARLAREFQRTSLRVGDLILSVVGSMGRSAVVGPNEDGFNLNRPLARLQLRTGVPPRLIWHWIQTTHFLDMAKLATGGGTAQPTLNLGDLANFKVGLPQADEHWSRVLASLEDECGRLDETEVSVGKQVELLLERRQSLITAAVSRQLDIAGAA